MTRIQPVLAAVALTLCGACSSGPSTEADDCGAWSQCID